MAVYGVLSETDTQREILGLGSAGPNHTDKEIEELVILTRTLLDRIGAKGTSKRTRLLKSVT
jgi:hypothetical protein